MPTIYVVVRKKFYERLENPVQGVAYHQASRHGPASAGQIAEATAAYFRDHPEDGCPTPDQIDEAVRSLVLRGFLAGES